MHHDAQPLYTWRGNRGPAQSTGGAAKGRRPVYAGSDAHAFARARSRTKTPTPPGWPTRASTACRSGRRSERNARDRFSPPAAVDQTTQSPGGLRLFLQPAAIPVRAVLFQEPDSPGRCRNVAAGRGRAPAAEEPQTLAKSQTAGPCGRRSHPGLRHLGASPHFRRTLGWAFHLIRGKIQRHTAAPASRIPMRSGRRTGPTRDQPGVSLPLMPPSCPDKRVEKAA